LELDVTLAQERLENLRAQLSERSGTRRGSITLRIRTLEKRIERFRDYKWPAGSWQSHAEFRTERAKDVEKLSHEILADRLDEAAPMGEIFSCSPADAVQAVERALDRLGLLESANTDSSSGGSGVTRISDPGLGFRSRRCGSSLCTLSATHTPWTFFDTRIVPSRKKDLSSLLGGPTRR